MKTLRVVLTALAVVLAVGGSVASVLRTPQPIVYDYIDNPGSTPDQCVAVSLTCDTSGPKACKVNASDPRTLRQNDDPSASTKCGQQLFRN